MIQAAAVNAWRDSLQDVVDRELLTPEEADSLAMHRALLESVELALQEKAREAARRADGSEFLPGGSNALRRDDEVKHQLRAIGKDPSEYTFEERQRMVFSPDGQLVSQNGTEPKMLARRVLATPAAEVERSQVEWLEPGRIPRAQVTVVAGIGGLGKSQLTCALAARNSRGEFGVASASLIATAEDDPSTTVRPRLETVQADLGRVHFLTIATKEGDEDGIAIPDDVAQLEEMVRELGATLLVIDPLVAHLPGEIDSHRDQSVRRALAPLYRLAKNTACAVVVVLHLNKSTGLAPLMRLGASVAFGNAARSVLLLDRDPDDPDGERGHRRVLAHIKCNVAPLAPSLLYQVAPIVLPAEDGAPMVETSRLELLGESEHDGRALLSAGDDEQRSELDEAVEFLSDYLADGTRHKASEIYTAAKQLRIADMTLKRARRKLGAKTAKSDFRAGWEWWIPEGTKRTDSEGANPHSSTKSSEGSTNGPLVASTATEATKDLAYLDEETKSKALVASWPLRAGEDEEDIP